jgi:hypothetical protein
MEPSDEQGRVGRLWVTACRAADAEDWTRAEYAAVELAVGPIGLVDLIAEAMLLGLCRRAWRRGWTAGTVAAEAGLMNDARVNRLLGLVVRLEQARSRGGRPKVPPGWLTGWRSANGLTLTESYLVVVRARSLLVMSPPSTGGLSA